MGGFRASDLAPAILGGAQAFARRPTIRREAFRAAIEDLLAEEGLTDVRRRRRFEERADPLRLRGLEQGIERGDIGLAGARREEEFGRFADPFRRRDVERGAELGDVGLEGARLGLRTEQEQAPLRTDLLRTQGETARFGLSTERERAPIETGRLRTQAEREALGLRTEEEQAPLRTDLLRTQGEEARFGLSTEREQAPLRTGLLGTQLDAARLGLETERERAPIQTGLLRTQADVAEIGRLGAQREEERAAGVEPLTRRVTEATLQRQLDLIELQGEATRLNARLEALRARGDVDPADPEVVGFVRDLEAYRRRIAAAEAGAPPVPLTGAAVRGAIQEQIDGGSTTPTTLGWTHTVRRGETLSAIARRAGTTVEAIVRANPEITDPDRIREGQVIRLPGGR